MPVAPHNSQPLVSGFTTCEDIIGGTRRPRQPVPKYETARGIETNSYADQPRASHGVSLAERGGPTWEGHYNYMAARNRRKELDKMAAREKDTFYFSSDSDDENDYRGRPPRPSDYRKDAAGMMPYGTTRRSVVSKEPALTVTVEQPEPAESSDQEPPKRSVLRRVFDWCSGAVKKLLQPFLWLSR